MKLSMLALASVVILAGCEVSEQYEKKTNVIEEMDGRIQVKRLSIISDCVAYGCERGTYLITDTKTGIEYIGVSGIGITEVGAHSYGKTSAADER